MERSSSRTTYLPLPWEPCFRTSIHLTPPDSAFTHHAYFTPPRTPASPLFVLIHGAGASGLTFAALTQDVAHALPDAGFLAPDMRGHGGTEPRANVDDAALQRENGEDGSLDMQLGRLAADTEAVLKALKEKEGWAEWPSLVLVGHSLGGAVATRVAASELLKGKVLGLGVLDVVEGMKFCVDAAISALLVAEDLFEHTGSAVDALSSMSNYLSTRPTTFPSLETGIEWQ